MRGKTLTARQLSFCLLIVDGETQSMAYAKAGYKVPGTAQALTANASKLLKTASIQSEIARLREKAIAKTAITLEKLVSDAFVIRDLAIKLEQPAAATGALALAARLAGFLVDRKEVDITHHKPARMPALKDLELSEDDWIRLYKPPEVS